MIAEEQLRTVRVELPTKGVLQGVDPAASDSEFPPHFAADMLNVRVLNGRFDTRAGMVRWQQNSADLPGSGTVTFLYTYYKSDGTIYRLLGRNGILYQALAPNGAWTQASNGTGFNKNPAYGQWQAVTVRDTVYIVDRSRTLYKWDPTNGVQQVQQPNTPAAPPGVNRRSWALLEDWSNATLGSAPRDWTGTTGSSTDFPLTVSDPDADFVALPTPPIAGTTANIAKIVDKTTGGHKGEAWNHNNAGGNPWVPSSHSIAFWLNGNGQGMLLSFNVGYNQAAQYPNPIQVPAVNTAYVYFVPIGNLPTLAYLQLQRLAPAAGTNKTYYLGPIVLPGYLLGQYQWCYTYYHATTKIESAASPQPTSYMDFSQPETSFTADPNSLQKCAELTFVSNIGASGPATNRIRLYRNGGVPQLTIDPQGNVVWTLVAEMGDISSTIRGALKWDGTATAMVAGYASVIVPTGQGAANLQTNAANPALNDWLVLDYGVPGLQEHVQVAYQPGSTLPGVTINSPTGYDTILLQDFGVAITDLAVDATTNTKVTSAIRPFTTADVGRTLNIVQPTGSTAWTAGRYIIGAVDGSNRASLYSGGSLASPAAGGTTGGQATLYNGVKYAHQSSVSASPGATVTPGYVDNVADEFLDASRTIEIERYSPTTGAQWVSLAPDGRLWLAQAVDTGPGTGGTGTAQKLHVCVSNLPTLLHPNDHEVFPRGVSPILRQSPLQGWDFDISGDGAGDSITWAGFVHGVFTVLTTRHLYQVYAANQQQFTNSAVVRVLDNVGTLAGETVRFMDGRLIWVSHAGNVPRVVEWSGPREGGVRELSYLRLTTTFQNAPQGFWGRWFARSYVDKNGAQYRLCLTPSQTYAYTDLAIDGSNAAKVTSAARPFVAGDVGQLLDITAGTGFTANTGPYQIQSVSSGAAILDRNVGSTGSTAGSGTLYSGNTRWLDYTLAGDCWEPRSHNDANGNPIPWASAVLLGGPGDDYTLRAAAAVAGKAYQFESGITDDGQAIAVSVTTKRYSLAIHLTFQHKFIDEVYQPEAYFLRLNGVNDTASVQLVMGGSEYGVTSETDSIALNGVNGVDTEFKQRAQYDLVRGRWFQFLWSGSFSNGPALREITAGFQPIRAGRVSS